MPDQQDQFGWPCLIECTLKHTHLKVAFSTLWSTIDALTDADSIVRSTPSGVSSLYHSRYFLSIRPDQFNLLLLGYCEVKIGPSDQKKKEKKAINWGVVIDHNLIKTD